MAFQPGNPHAAAGGRARAEALTPERRAEIARLGFLATTERHFDGDAQAHVEWLTRLEMLPNVVIDKNEVATVTKTVQQNGAGISEHDRLANACNSLLAEVPKIRALLGGSGTMTDSLAHTLTIIITTLRRREQC